MFIDSTKLYLKAGNGGNGCVAFHREKYVAAGGPVGGDGGKGGDVVFMVDKNLNTLEHLRYTHHMSAKNGEDGKPNKFHGATADDLIIKVPAGTVVKDAESGKIIDCIKRISIDINRVRQLLPGKLSLKQFTDLFHTQYLLEQKEHIQRNDLFPIILLPDRWGNDLQLYVVVDHCRSDRTALSGIEGCDSLVQKRDHLIFVQTDGRIVLIAGTAICSQYLYSFHS